MGDLELRKAEALRKWEAEEKERKKKQIFEMGIIMTARLKYSFDFGGLVPYRIVEDWERLDTYTKDKKSLPVMPNRYYPRPARSIELDSLYMQLMGDLDNVELRLKADELEKQEEMKLDIETVLYYYSRFFDKYDFTTFQNKDWTGEPIPEEQEKMFREAHIAFQKHYREHPEEYDPDEHPRKEEHRYKYETGYRYL